MCSPGCCGGEVIAVSLMLSSNEVAELSEAKLIRLIRIQRWKLGSRSVDPKVHELDGRSGMFAVGEKYEGLQKRLSRNEVAELSGAELIHLVHLQLGTPRSKRVDPKGP